MLPPAKSHGRARKNRYVAVPSRPSSQPHRKPLPGILSRHRPGSEPMCRVHPGRMPHRNGQLHHRREWKGVWPKCSVRRSVQPNVPPRSARQKLPFQRRRFLSHARISGLHHPTLHATHRVPSSVPARARIRARRSAQRNVRRRALSRLRPNRQQLQQHSPSKRPKPVRRAARRKSRRACRAA